MSNPGEFLIKPFFGGFVLETLTVGMYGESRNAIREYIQNGFDSIEKSVKMGLLKEGEGTIEITMAVDRQSLSFRDNGAGLSTKHAGEILTRIGASTKLQEDSAGFRGIGRLAGIGFCNTLTFETKVRGENQATIVVFQGNKMRDLMSPGKAGDISADDLLRDCVTGSIVASNSVNEQYFEVKLEGFVDAPEECTKPELLRDFVSQVAPVGYQDSFPSEFKDKLKKAVIDTGVPIEEINIKLKDGNGSSVNIYKGYTDTYEVDGQATKLDDIQIYSSPDKNWWAWLGKRSTTGALDNVRVSGLRVRVKNIQIDGVDVVRELLKQKAPSHIRFQEWSVGEVFVKSTFLVPNARRDGFEETPSWKRMRKELTDTIVSDIKANSYNTSKATQTTPSILQSKLEGLQTELAVLRRSNFQNTDKILELSVATTKLTKSVATATKNADLETIADLQAIASELSDIKTEALSRLPSQMPLNRMEIEQSARNDLLAELLILFESELDPSCYISVRNLIKEQYGL
jgi:hypothetical protein